MASDSNTNLAVPGAIAISILFAIALLFFALRLYSRVRPTLNLSASDYTISVAVFCELITYITSIIAISTGFGRSSITLAAQTKISKCVFVVAFFGGLAAPIARASMGAMLLRFELSTTRKMIIWALVILQALIALSSCLVMLLQCHPINAFWENVPGGVCWSNKNSQTYGYTATSLGIFSDVVFALIPALYIWPLRRPVIERILLCVLMGLGLFAAIAASIKLNYIRTWKYGEESVGQTVSVFMWFRVEEICLVAAACAPYLKGAVEAILTRVSASKFGFILSNLQTNESKAETTTKDVSKGDTSAV